MKIPTKDSNGRDNGWLQPLWNVNDFPQLRPDQVYVTAVLPGTRKGPHLHMKRRGMFFCIQGEVRIRTKGPVLYEDHYIAADSPRITPLMVHPGRPCAIYNEGTEVALVVNMPSPAWSKEDPDDHEVTVWKDPEGWPRSNIVAVVTESAHIEDGPSGPALRAKVKLAHPLGFPEYADSGCKPYSAATGAQFGQGVKP